MLAYDVYFKAISVFFKLGSIDGEFGAIENVVE